MADGLVDAAMGHLISSLDSGSGQGVRHVLEAVAARNWTSLKNKKQSLSLDYLTQWLAGVSDLEFFRINPLKIDVAAVTGCISRAYAERYHILPIRMSDSEVVFATAEPFDRDWEKELEGILRRKIGRVIVNPRDIVRYIKEFYALSHSVRGAGEQSAAGQSRGVQNFEQLTELGQGGKLDADDRHIVNIVDSLFQYAFDQRASDIHLEPGRERGGVRFRIDGVLHPVYDVPSSVFNAITSRIKILGRMDVAEKRRPQDGRIKTRKPNGDEIELRLSTMPLVFGEKLVMRIFNPDVLLKKTEELGFSSNEATIWKELLGHPYGIVLVTGPTGSGKTTTLYSSMRELATPEVNLCTIEDPIELVVPGISQMQVQHNIDLSFSTGVRTLLRQDPDIIMIGEIRDKETAEMATQAALTGHLVLSTLHTNDSPSTITRLIELGVPAYLIKATLLGVVAQRLVRTLCPHCKAPTEVSEKRWQQLISPWKHSPPKQIYQPVGCDHCRETGYLGRIGLYELLRITPAVKSLIHADTDISTLRRAGIKDGLLPLRLAGANKIAQGVTSLEEVDRMTPSLQQFE